MPPLIQPKRSCAVSETEKATVAARVRCKHEFNRRLTRVQCGDDVGRLELEIASPELEIHFVGDKRNPRDENGEFDYEHLNCVDIPRLSSDLNALVRGESVHMRKFDFRAHEGFDEEQVTSITDDGFIVIEGIHALNPLLTEGVSDALKFRIFIDPQPKLEVFVHTRLSSRDSRLVRRLVRDSSFRGMSPATTFAMWPKVLAGEDKWILPFRGNADAEFDSSLDYELAVLRNYAEGPLRLVAKKDPSNIQAHMLADLLSVIDPVSPVSVPGDSILRETIGGSQLEY